VANQKVGTITHYYDKIGVAIVDLIASLSVGDKIKIVKDDQEFEQEVKSIQVEHKQVKTAKKGESVGLKVDQEVKEKAEVYKV
jgi:putative protease